MYMCVLVPAEPLPEKRCKKLVILLPPAWRKGRLEPGRGEVYTVTHFVLFE